MSAIIIPQNHISFTASQNVSEICKTLFQKYPINYFDWVRLYSNGSLSMLASNAEYIVHHYKKGYKFLPSIQFEEKPTTFHFIKTNPLLENVTLEMKEMFSIDNYFLLIHKHKDYLEVFAFGTFPNFQDPMNFYLNHLEELEKFTLLFRDKAQPLIREAYQSRFFLSEDTKLEYKDVLSFISCHPSLKKKEFSFFDKIIPIIQGRLEEILHHFEIQLTLQEKNCLIHTFLGMNSISISKEFTISPRTVQTHLENVKKKFGVYKKSDLLELFKTY